MTAGASFYEDVNRELASIEADGLFKVERVIASPQSGTVKTVDGRELINLCANNYLGLSSHPSVVAAAHKALDARGFGLSSVRFICGTQDIHKELERRLSQFLGTEDTILYAAAFDANGGLFEPLLGERDAVVSDALNHASIIDGIRLCKAKRYRYANNDMADLEVQLKLARSNGARHVLIFTDGVFSMDGTVAKLDQIRTLADQYDALVGVDECHATGILGDFGKGTHEYRGLLEDGKSKIDIITGTLGKALGGASGGFTSGRKEVIDLLRQRSRPYLFSNSLAPPIVAATIAVLDLVESSQQLHAKLKRNTTVFRREILNAGFDIKPGDHPIVPVMLYDAATAQEFSRRLYELGVLALGFFYPVVPAGQARIRTQVSAVHEPEQLMKAVEIFAQVKQDLGI
jgi:glycine C-acetyltransferase